MSQHPEKSGVIERTALGRNAALGALYNACEDWFLGANVFEQLKPKYVKEEERPTSHLQLSYEESYSGRFGKLYVQSELQLSTLSGLVKLSPEYTKFLSDEDCATVIFQVRTTQESVELDNRRLKKYVALKILTATEATHFVSGIVWGANTFMSLEGQGQKFDAATKTWIRGQIEAKFHTTVLAELAGSKAAGDNSDWDGGAKNSEGGEEGEGGILESSSFKVYGDMFPNAASAGANYSFTKAKEIVRQTRAMVGKLNGGKGSPLVYILTPVVEIANRLGLRLDFPPVFKKLEDQTLSRLMAFFDDLLSAKRAFNLFFEEAVVANLDTSSIRDRKRLMEIAERAVRHRLAKSVIAYRSGRADASMMAALLSELRTNKDITPESIRAFIEHNLESLAKYREEVEEREKMKWIKELGAKGVRYLWISDEEGSGHAKLREELTKVDMADVMIYTDVEQRTKDDRWMKNRELFEKIVDAEEGSSSTVASESSEHHHGDGDESNITVHLFCIVEFETLPIDSPRACIQRYVRGRKVSDDVLADYQWFASQNLVTISGIYEKGYPVPHFSLPLKIACPGASIHNDDEDDDEEEEEEASKKKKCEGGSGGPREWQCVVCRTFVVYGRDDYFYCECGRAHVANFLFKCSDDHSHKGKFLAFRPEENLPKMVKTMAGELEEINILLLGETGVGKSTFINAFANYLSYSDLSEAEKNDFIILIPTSFTLIDENYEERTVSVEPSFADANYEEGNDDANETLQAGASATQACKAYVFPFADKIVRLIDTPGIGDTRGIDQDKKNFDNILAFLGFHREIHGICILLKPNNARLSVFFRYCIQQLMFHLHKNASENITFVFTNARSTFYRPGDTLPALRKMLGDIKVEPPHVDIPFSQKTTFCLDNESFRFMVALRNGVSFTEEDKKNFTVSWNTSVSECKRLMEHVSSRKPHEVRDTISVNDARRLIALLSQPIGDITQIIQENLSQLEIERKKFESNTQDILDLQQDLFIPVVKVAYVKLPAPRTVCTSPKCKNASRAKPPPPVVPGGGSPGIEVAEAAGKPTFVTYSVCCSPCWLASVKGASIWQYLSQKTPQGLRLCTAFHKVSGICKECGCNWKTHAHQFTEAKQTTLKVRNTTIDGKIRTKEELKELLEDHVNKLRQRVVELEEEQHSINRIVASFAYFCSENAISPYNDAYKDYLDYLIKVRESQSGNETVVDGLKKAKGAYETRLKMLQDAMKEHDAKVPTVSANDVSVMVRDLYRLKHNGSMIEQAVEESKKATDALHVTYSEVVYSKGKKLVRSEGDGPTSIQALQGWVDGKASRA